MAFYVPREVQEACDLGLVRVFGGVRGEGSHGRRGRRRTPPIPTPAHRLDRAFGSGAGARRTVREGHGRGGRPEVITVPPPCEARRRQAGRPVVWQCAVLTPWLTEGRRPERVSDGPTVGDGAVGNHDRINRHRGRPAPRSAEPRSPTRRFPTKACGTVPSSPNPPSHRRWCTDCARALECPGAAVLVVGHQPAPTDTTARRSVSSVKRSRKRDIASPTGCCLTGDARAADRHEEAANSLPYLDKWRGSCGEPADRGGIRRASVLFRGRRRRLHRSRRSDVAAGRGAPSGGRGCAGADRTPDDCARLGRPRHREQGGDQRPVHRRVGRRQPAGPRRRGQGPHR